MKPGALERLVKAPTERKGPPNRQPEVNALAREPDAMMISELMINDVLQITSSPVWISKVFLSIIIHNPTAPPYIFF